MVEGSGVAVLPGDLVHLPSTSTRPGPGVVVVGTAKDKSGKEKVGAVVSKAGLLRRKEEEAAWVHNQQKRVSEHNMAPSVILHNSVCKSTYTV